MINYNLGKDLVKQFVESRGGVASQPGQRWAGVRAAAGVAALAVGTAVATRLSSVTRQELADGLESST